MNEDGLRLANAVRAIRRLRLRGRVPPGLVVNHGVGACQGEARAARLQADEEDVHLTALERVDGRLPISRGAGQQRVPSPALQELLGDHREHAGELREDENAPALGELRLEHRQERVELGRVAHVPRAIDRDELRMAAHLPQLHERVQDRHRRGTEALLADDAPHLRVRGHADALVELALRAEQLDVPDEEGLRRELLQHLLLRAPEHEGRDALAQEPEPLFVAVALDGVPEARAELLGAAEHAGGRCLEQRPELVQVVLHRGAAQTDALTGVELRHGLVRTAARVLHGLRLVQHEHRVAFLLQ